MRLVSLFFAVLLAVTAGILVISMPQAAASGGSHVVATLDHGHAHATHAHKDFQKSAEGSSLSGDQAATTSDCANSSSETHDSSGTDCCTMGACHAFQLAAAPVVHAPCLSSVPIAAIGDEQVEGIDTGGFDRPPRTV